MWDVARIIGCNAIDFMLLSCFIICIIVYIVCEQRNSIFTFNKSIQFNFVTHTHTIPTHTYTNAHTHTKKMHTHIMYTKAFLQSNQHENIISS